ncbi:MAG: DNA-3-methyladenine glycosylase family protein [Candidatus Nealsonbacteria bacterium]
MKKIINLKKSFSIILNPVSPYNFNATVHKPSHFPSSDNDWSKGKYWITMLWKGEYLGLKFENKGIVNSPKIKLNVYSKEALSEKYKKSLIEEVEWRFNLKSDISEFSKKFKNDKFLSPLIKKWKGMKPAAANSFYETLIIYVVLQNAIVRRSVQMLENLFDRFGKKVKFNNKTLSTFWEPKAIDKVLEQVLRDLKLGYRAKFLKSMSSQFKKHAINEFKMRTMDREELKKQALKLYGIGPASVEYLLFEDFYHYDALETIPPWEQKIMSKLLFNKKLVSAKRILNFFKKRYAGWEKLAFHYIWEDVFWKRKTQHIEWLEKEIRL